MYLRSLTTGSRTKPATPPTHHAHTYPPFPLLLDTEKSGKIVVDDNVPDDDVTDPSQDLGRPILGTVTRTVITITESMEFKVRTDRPYSHVYTMPSL